MTITQKIKKGILSLAAAILVTGCANTKNFMSVEGYRDTRGMNVGTISGSANLPLKTNTFAFIEYETEQGTDNIKRPYGEIMLSKKAKNGLGVAVEYDRNFALPKGTTRTGFVFEPSFLRKLDKNLFLGVKYFPSSTDNQGEQLGIYGKKTFSNGDFYVGGYFDYDFKSDAIVTDLQFGKRIKENLHLIVKGRLNEFRAKGDQKGIGVGLEWKF